MCMNNRTVNYRYYLIVYIVYIFLYKNVYLAVNCFADIIKSNHFYDVGYSPSQSGQNIHCH